MIGVLLIKMKVPEAFNSLNRHDLEGFLKNYHEEAVFEYPGNITPSGVYKGKIEIRKWFNKLFEQFPLINFKVKEISIANPFDLIGNNVIQVLWEIDLENRQGQSFHNSGVTVIKSRLGKSIYTKDFIFDTGEEFRKSWGE